MDDPAKQRLRLVVRDDDFGWGDKVLGVAEVALDQVGGEGYQDYCAFYIMDTNDRGCWGDLWWCRGGVLWLVEQSLEPSRASK